MSEKQSSNSCKTRIKWASVTLPGGGLDLHVDGKERQLHPRMADPPGGISGKFVLPFQAQTPLRNLCK